MNKFHEYTLTITDPSTSLNTDFVWPVIKWTAWAFCLKTEIDEVWFESDHEIYSSGNVNITLDQLHQYLEWIDFQLNTDSNLYVEITAVDAEQSVASKGNWYNLPFTSNRWCDSTNKWIVHKLKSKTINIPPKIIDETLTGQLLAPFWFLKKVISSGGRDTLTIIRKVRLSDFSALFLNATTINNGPNK